MEKLMKGSALSTYRMMSYRDGGKVEERHTFLSADPVGKSYAVSTAERISLSLDGRVIPRSTMKG